MAYILRSVFFIGVIYTLSPLHDGERGLEHLRAPAARAAADLAAVKPAMAGPATGAWATAGAAAALEAAHAWSALDARTRADLYDLVSQTAGQSPVPGPAGPASRGGDTQSGGDPLVPWLSRR
jgi:hypothetical protein